MPPLSTSGLLHGRITSGLTLAAAATFWPIVQPLTVIALAVEQSVLEQRTQHRRQAAGVVEVLHEEAARGHQVDERRHVAAEAVPVVERQRHAQPAGNRDQSG